MAYNSSSHELANGRDGEQTLMTFGIEIEFFLITEMGQHLQTKTILETVLSRSFHDVCALPGCQIEHIAHLNVSTDSDHSVWTVGRDHTLELTPDEQQQVPHIDQRFEIHRCEIQSPAFMIDVRPPNTDNFDHQNHQPWFSYNWQIQHAFRIINSVNDPEKYDRNLRVFVNSSCGLHVHVRSGIPSRGFELQTIKNVMSLQIVFERQFDSAQEKSRIGGTLFGKQEKESAHTTKVKRVELPGSKAWCSPLSSHHRRRVIQEVVDRENETVRDPTDTTAQSNIFEPKYPVTRYNQDDDLRLVGALKNMLAWHQVIQKAQTTQDLMDLYAHLTAKHSSFNAQHCSQEQGINTLEFRQHAGKLDYHQVMVWIYATVRTVEWCDEVSQNDFGSLIYQEWDNPDFSFVDLLHRIDAPSGAIEHYEWIINVSDKENDKAYERAMEVEEMHPPRDPLTPLVRFVESERRLNRCRQAVRKRIELNYASVCYGAFPVSR